MDYVARFGPENRRFETYFADARVASKICAPKHASPECKFGGSSNKEDMSFRPFMVCISEERRKDGENMTSEDIWIEDLMTEYLGSRPD